MKKSNQKNNQRLKRKNIFHFSKTAPKLSNLLKLIIIHVNMVITHLVI